MRGLGGHGSLCVVDSRNLIYTEQGVTLAVSCTYFTEENHNKHNK